MSPATAKLIFVGFDVLTIGVPIGLLVLFVSREFYRAKRHREWLKRRPSETAAAHLERLTGRTW